MTFEEFVRTFHLIPSRSTITARLAWWHRYREDSGSTYQGSTDGIILLVQGQHIVLEYHHAT